MRPIHLARLDKIRPVRVLTRELVRPHLGRVTVAPITSTTRGLSTEVPAGPPNGLDHESAVSCDYTLTVPVAALGRQIGYLLPTQEPDLTHAIRAAFDLETQAELAARAGITQSVVSAYESGRRQPSLPVMHGLVNAAGLELGLPADLGLLGLGRLRAALEEIVGAPVDLVPEADLKPQVRPRVERESVAL